MTWSSNAGMSQNVRHNLDLTPVVIGSYRRQKGCQQRNYEIDAAYLLIALQRESTFPTFPSLLLILMSAIGTYEDGPCDLLRPM